jgi:SAM-dependent methyltransferase
LTIDRVAAQGFEAGAAAYELARPGYPDEAVSVLQAKMGLAAGVRVLDLAAGTGKLTRRLLELGTSVVAVEPVDGMRAQLRQAVPGVEVIDGTGEAIPLPDASVDVVTVAQAFHWNERDESTPWVAEMSRIIRWHERTVSRYQHVSWAAIVGESGLFTPLQEQVVQWDQPITQALLADRVRSISYIAAMPQPERERQVADVVSLVRRIPEPFPLPYTCRVQWAHLA